MSEPSAPAAPIAKGRSRARRASGRVIALIGLCLCLAAPATGDAAAGAEPLILAQGAPAEQAPPSDAQPPQSVGEPEASPAGGSLPVSALDPATLPRDFTPLGMFLNADVVVKAVMIGLILASVVTWAVFIAKAVQIAAARAAARAGRLALRNARSLDEAERHIEAAGAVEDLIREAGVELDLSPGMPAAGIKERVASRLDRVEAAASRRIAAGVGVLATIGATAPFVGLFGTVWGIMNSFIGISEAETTNLAVVAPGIAEALLATGLGLFAAIPAVVIYNLFSRWASGYRAELADSSAEILRLIGRDLDRQPDYYAQAAQ